MEGNHTNIKANLKYIAILKALSHWFKPGNSENIFMCSSFLKYGNGVFVIC